MTPVRRQYWQRYAPRTISTEIFKTLVESLDQFKLGLSTTSRKIKSRAISHQGITDLHGPQSWRVVDSHPLAKLEHLHTELLLVANGTDSCELHIEFRGEHVFLSVSDIQTQWGKAVFEEARDLLATIGITPGGWKNFLATVYDVADISQNILMITAVGMFAIWLQGEGRGYLYAALGLFVSGVIPTLRRLLYYFNPPKRRQIIKATAVNTRRFPWPEVISILGFLGAVLGLAKEVFAWWATR